MRIVRDEPAVSESMPSIGLRWWIDRAGELRVGWPPIGAEAACLAIGWIADRDPKGVVEATEIPWNKVVDALNARFPGREWVEGGWKSGAARSLRIAA